MMTSMSIVFFESTSYFAVRP